MNHLRTAAGQISPAALDVVESGQRGTWLHRGNG
jgi:hypothetical protein